MGKQRSHIVARCYLKGFASPGDKVEMLLRDATSGRPISTKDAGVRKGIYRRTLPDGRKVDDVEPGLGLMETSAAPLLRTLDRRWPLTLDDKAVLAELFGRQVVRGPWWMQWHTEKAKTWVEGVGETGLDNVPAEFIRLHRVEIHEHLGSDNTRMTRMLSLGTKITAVFAAMHWTLLEFRNDVVATSDQPVVWWPIDAGSRRPTTLNMDYGIAQTLEVRVPVTSRSAILMTWADHPDAQSPRVAGTRDHARNLNAFTIAQADAQWFHLPGTTPPMSAGGRLAPLSPALIPGYGMAAAQQSARRRRVQSSLEPWTGKDRPGGDFEMVWVR